MRRSRELLFNADTQKLELLLTPLDQLGLTLEGSQYLAEAIRIARADLKRVRITRLQPYFYLSTGYGTVAGTTSIALGFYDSNDLLRDLNRETRGFQYTFDDIVNTVRHEIGHAFSYAYKLYRRKDFRQIFKVKGNYFLTYPETNRYILRANPWSRDYVNPSGDHYAQKHPDDDFAETFTVWLQPRYNWRYDYRNYPGALRKLEFVDALVQELRHAEPLANQAPYLYEPLDSFRITLARFLKLRSTRYYRQRATGYIDPDLKDLFSRPRPYWGTRRRERDYIHADNFIRKHKREVVRQVSRWVGVAELVVKDLLDKCSGRTHALDLWVRKDERDRKLVEFTSYVSYRCALYALNDSYIEGK
ncbi:MAG: putative zinc-binding metallopeptidase [Anaerolineales bacterium]